MLDAQPLNESALAREYLRRISEEKSVLRRAVRVLDLIARSSVGLGEVLQDYAAQASQQLHDVLRVAENVVHGNAVMPEDAQILENVHFALKTVKAVLEMTPAAMQRNKAEAVGEKEKLSRSDISEIADAFLRSADVARLLATEDSGHVFSLLVAQSETDNTLMASKQGLTAASARH